MAKILDCDSEDPSSILGPPTNLRLFYPDLDLDLDYIKWDIEIINQEIEEFKRPRKVFYYGWWYVVDYDGY